MQSVRWSQKAHSMPISILNANLYPFTCRSDWLRSTTVFFSSFLVGISFVLIQGGGGGSTVWGRVMFIFQPNVIVILTYTTDYEMVVRTSSLVTGGGVWSECADPPSDSLWTGPRRDLGYCTITSSSQHTRAGSRPSCIFTYPQAHTHSLTNSTAMLYK